MPVQRDNPAIQQVLRVALLTAEVVDKKDAISCFKLKWAFIIGRFGCADKIERLEAAAGRS